MTLKVLYFASLRDRTGTAEEAIDVADGADVAALWATLTERHPGLRAVGVRPLAACDRTYAAWDRPLAGVAEVAFLPPV
ncbi:MAG TPA: MoaD/ThiS family protein, partial [Candidatus Polarisedimenticolaceae bacterium]|nr:MoaD/ThiS family protein [Candidatus Polarisedimenticolaceae bacterium]